MLTACAATVVRAATGSTLICFCFCFCGCGWLVTHAHGQGNTFAGNINFQYLGFYDIASFDHVMGVFDKFVRQRRDVHQAILMHTDIDKSAKVGDVGDSAFHDHARYQVF